MVPTTADLTSGLVTAGTALVAIFDSDFLFVTEAFDCSATAFAAALDKGFAFDDAAVVLVPNFVALAGVSLGDFTALTGLLTTLASATLGFETFVFAIGFTAAAFFGAGFVADFDGLVFDAVGFAAFAGELRGFAGFFIAFAMESTTI